MNRLFSRRSVMQCAGAVCLDTQRLLLASRVVVAHEPQIEEFEFSSLKTLYTPPGEFFVRNHFTRPALDLRRWKLRVSGRVRSPFEIGYAELLRESDRTVSATLECAGNQVGGGAVSTASWTGASLKELLRRADLMPGVRAIRLTGADRGRERPSATAVAFARSIPIEKALHEDTILAYRMNGAPLPPEHGYPLRAIVPGHYAMDCVKWVVQIDALDQDDTSFFMTRQYVAIQLEAVTSKRRPVTQMRVKSQIARPYEGEVLSAGVYTVLGTAWAGANAVASVEVSTNAGKDWAPATFDPPDRPYVWVLWNYRWEPAVAGEYIVLVRAVDNRGEAQPDTRDSRRLDGYELNWRHAVHCTVR